MSLFFNPLLAGGPTPFRPGRVGFAAGAFAPEPLPLPPAPPFALPPALLVAAPIVVRDLVGRRAAAPANPRRAENASVAAVGRAMPPIDAETRASDAATGLGADPTRGGARSSNDVRGEDSIAPLLSQLMHARPTPPPMPPSHGWDEVLSRRTVRDPYPNRTSLKPWARTEVLNSRPSRTHLGPQPPPPWERPLVGAIVLGVGRDLIDRRGVNGSVASRAASDVSEDAAEEGIRPGQGG